MAYSANLSALVQHYTEYNGSRFFDRALVLDILSHGVRYGFITAVEQKNPYTFGGVTVSLTDSELASALSELRRNRKINVIKTIRNIGDVSLADAKVFADHLGEIASKMD